MKMRRIKSVLISMLLVLSCAGCSTIMVHSSESPTIGGDPCNKFPPYVFGGTLADLGLMLGGVVYLEDTLESPITTLGMAMYGITDLPLSFAADTLVLPVSVYKQLVVCSRREEENGQTNNTLE